MPSDYQQAGREASAILYALQGSNVHHLDCDSTAIADLKYLKNHHRLVLVVR